jgi:DNA-binding GntR family transcriptional regulator
MAELQHLEASASLGDQAYTTVRQAIISGVLARGAKVTERGLAESLNISPTPVREALRRLEQDQLVTREGPRSVRIADFDEGELHRITMIEDSLRALAARLAADNASDEQIDGMRRALERAERLSDSHGSGGPDVPTLREITLALREFHASIDRASGSPTLIHMLHMVDAFNYDERLKKVADQLAEDPRVIRERFEHHRLIFEAIVARQPLEAERIMREHSRSSNEWRLATDHPDV